MNKTKIIEIFAHGRNFPILTRIVRIGKLPLDKPAGSCYNRPMNKKITWYKANDKLFGSLEDAKNEIMKNHPELLDDDMPDFFDTHIEEVVSDKFNGYVNAHNWADWHGEP